VANSSRGTAPWWTSLAQGWQSALESLTSHKLRSVLTLLGIVIGVAAVLAINVFGQLTTQAVARQFGPLGATLVSISPQAPLPPPGAQPGLPVKVTADTPGFAKPVPPPDLDEKDLQALRSVPHVTAAALHGRVPPVQAVGNGQNGQARLMAATPEIQSILGYAIASGSFFTEQDEASRANVVVIGATIARTVFAGMDPVGQPVHLNGVPFTIKGVFAAQGSNGELDLDNIGVVPYSVLDRLRGNGVMFAIGQTNPTASNGVLLQVDDVQNLKTVESSAIQLIQQSHPPKPSELPWVASDFAEAVRTASQSTSDVRLVLTGITVVALLLGAFGMFSIMTVSVTERTREIGLRMAVGARTRDVLLQFLLEAALLGLVGGCLGALLGSGLAVLATGLLRPLAGLFALPSPDAVVEVLLGSIVLGVLFGVLPARRAASLDPASALRRA